jgi:Flp pilus assembly protein TadD
MANRSLELSPTLRAHLASQGDAFLADFLARAVARNPTALDALSELAQVLTRLGRHREGLRADLALARACPSDPTVLYNLACSLSLVGRLRAALATLRLAIEHGYDDREHLRADEDLKALHDQPEFWNLLSDRP